MFALPLFFCLLSIAEPSPAQSIIINATGQELSATTKEKLAPGAQGLSQNKESSWLRAFSLRLAFKKALPEDEEVSARLNAQLKQAFDFFLAARIAESSEIVDEVSSQLFHQAPSTAFAKNAEEALVLKLLIATHSKRAEELSLADLPPEILPRLEKDHFLDKLPLRTQQALLKLPREKNKHQITHDFFSNASRVFVWGQEVELPLAVEPGRYLVHWITGTSLNAGWLNLAAESSASAPAPKPELEKLWSRSVFSVAPPQEIEASLIATQPKELSSSLASVLYLPAPDAVGSQPQVGRFRLRTPAPRAAQLPSKEPQKTSIDLKALNDAALAEKFEERPSLLKSPWFWAVAGSLVGLGVGSYYLYDSRQPRTVMTP